MAESSREVAPLLLPLLHLSPHGLDHLLLDGLQPEHFLTLHCPNFLVLELNKLPNKVSEPEAVEPLEEAEAEPAPVLCSFGEDLGVGLEEDHFEIEH